MFRRPLAGQSSTTELFIFFLHMGCWARKRPGPVSNKTECSFLPVPPFPFPFRPPAAAVGGGSESTARPHHFHFELSPTGQEMAAVLRSATRRLAGHLPALERGHIQLPGASFDPLKGHCSAHSGFTSHCSPQTAALHGGAFRPARIAPSSNPVGSMCTRMFSTPAGGSARPPQDKFWFEVVVHRTPCPENPRPCLYRKRFYNVDKDKAELIFRHFLSRVNQDSKAAASDSLKSRFTKLKFIVTDKLYLVLVGAALKSGKMQLLIVCALFYVLFLRAPSFMRRMARVAAPPAKGNESE